MSRRKNSLEKTLSDLDPWEQRMAVVLGRRGLKAYQSGVFDIAQGFRIALDIGEFNSQLGRSSASRAFKIALNSGKLNPNTPELGRSKPQILFLPSAVKKLFDLMVESVRKRDGGKLRLLADAVELTGARLAHDPVRACLLGMKASGATPLTANQVRNYIKQVSPEKMVTLKTIRRVAKTLNAPLAPGRCGAPPGRRKPVHHAAR